MKEKNVIYCLSILLVLSVFTVTWMLCRDIKRKDFSSHLYANNIELVNELKRMISNGKIELTDISVSCTNGNIMNLSDFICTENLLIYLPELTCMSCAERELEVFNDYFTRESLKEKVCIVSHFANIREQKVFERSSGIICLNIEDGSPFPIESMKDAMLCGLVDNSLKMWIYISGRNANIGIDIRKIFYSSVSERFKGRNINNVIDNE